MVAIAAGPEPLTMGQWGMWLTFKLEHFVNKIVRSKLHGILEQKIMNKVKGVKYASRPANFYIYLFIDSFLFDLMTIQQRM